MYDKEIDNPNMDNMSENDGIPPYGIDDFSGNEQNVAVEPVAAEAEATSEDIIQDDILADEQPVREPAKKNSNLVFVLTLVGMVVVLGISLLVIYSDSFNFASVSALVNKVNILGNKKEQNTQLPQDENMEQNMSPDSDTMSILNENSEEINFIKKGDGNMPTLPGADGTQDELMAELGPVRRPNVGRIDPFNPSGNSVGELFDILAPPMNPTPDVDAAALISVQISGIMYTPDAPSALIKIGGKDQLVRPGDVIEGVHVDRITKDKVTVRNGKNIFTASVGEIVEMESLGINTVPNINKKFAGPYSKGGRIIEINMIN